MPPDSDNSAQNHPSGNRVFATTSWSMVLDAADPESSAVRTALSELCRLYWFPLYAFVRKRGFNPAQAEDITQAFFTDLLEKNRLQAAQPSRGRFRSFLLTALSNFISNHHRAEQARKRGGDQTILSIDYQLADQRFNQLASDDLTPERIYDRHWAFSILEQALEAVSDQYEQAGKRELFQALQPCLSGQGDVPYAQIAQQLAMKEGAVKVAVYRLRQQYGQQLRLQISRTVQDPAEVDSELSSLFQALE